MNNKQIRKRFFFLLLVLVSVYSCIFNPKPRTSEELIPGRTNSYWKYKILSYERYDYHNFVDWEYEDFSSFRFELDDTTVIWTNTVRREIADIFNVEYKNSTYEVKAYTNTSLGIPKADPSLIQWLYHVSENGVYKMGGIFEEDTLITKEYLFPFPVNKDDSWQGGYIYYNNGFIVDSSICHECVNTNETLFTPENIFKNCHVISFIKKTAPDVSSYDHYFQYYSPGIGLVCQVLITTDRDSTYYRVENVMLLNEWEIAE